MNDIIKCIFCGYEFEKQEAVLACKNCFMSKTCKKTKCPNCGYEIIPEPKWFSKVFKRRKCNGTKS